MYQHGDTIEYGNGQTARVVRINTQNGNFAIVSPEGLYAHCWRDLSKTDEEVWEFKDEVNPWIPQWKFEFGDFPDADMPTLPEGWADTSYHNDMGPSFEHEAAGWRLWVQWSDPAQREFEDTPRFSLCPTDDRAWEFTHTAFDTWEQVTEFLGRYPTFAAYEAAFGAKG